MLIFMGTVLCSKIKKVSGYNNETVKPNGRPQGRPHANAGAGMGLMREITHEPLSLHVS